MVDKPTGANAESGPTVEELKQQRSSSKGSISRIKNVVDGNANLSQVELECRLAMVDSYYKQASHYQSQIEKTVPSDAGRSDIDELYVTARTCIMLRLNSQRRSSTFEQSFAFPSSQPTKKLPNLRLPKFDGCYLEYKNFINSFNSLVHGDATISIIEKFNHLLSCLSGEALNTVKSFQVTEANYQKALDRLKERYDNDILIFLENISTIFDVEKASKAESGQLRKIVDTISALYNSLKSLGSFEQSCDAIIIHLVVSKLDNDTKRKWDEYLDYSKLPKWSECCAMLDKRCQQLDPSSRRNMKPQIIQSQSSQVISKPKKHSMVTKAGPQKTCNFCSKSGHWVSECQEYLNLDEKIRLEEVQLLKLCVNCLSRTHSTSMCKSKFSCRFCQLRHHSSLHSGTDQKVSASTSELPTSSKTALIIKQDPIADLSTLSMHATSSTQSTIILATAIVLITDAYGHHHLVRALLDSCSQVNIICENLSRALNLKRSRANTDICGVGTTSMNMTHKTEAAIRSRINKFEMSLEFFIAPKITGYHPDETIEHFDLPANIKLADPEFQMPRGIDILLGTECFFAMLEPGKVVLSKNLPILQQTALGWIVTGKCVRKPPMQFNSPRITTNNFDQLNANVEKFWKLEEIQTNRKPTLEQEQCESYFKNSVAIDDTGRIMVRLPFKADPNILGNSQDVALRRFRAIEKKLSKNTALKADYCKFMREYEELGHMTLIPTPNLNQAHYFIPHHCVIKPSSETTKLRVVFDASCQTASQRFLNDTLMVGPTIQNDLAITLLRFRFHQYGMMDDITKMYRQILTHPQDRRFQLILWRPDKSQEICTYMLNTVTYGTAPVPFLAVRSLRYAAESFPLPYNVGKAIIRNDFYVDDMVTGADVLPSLLQIQKEVVEILDHFKFSLCKWHCSHPDLNLSSSRKIKFDDSTTNALGVICHPDKDVFEFSFQPKEHGDITKRTLLSLTSSLFDPIGLVSPTIIRARILLQHLWREKFGWDEPVPNNIIKYWDEISTDLQNLPKVKIQRFCRMANTVEVQLHGFGDASLKAYGCCFYLRCSDSFGNIAVNLLMSRA